MPYTAINFQTKKALREFARKVSDLGLLDISPDGAEFDDLIFGGSLDDDPDLLALIMASDPIHSIFEITQPGPWGYGPRALEDGESVVLEGPWDSHKWYATAERRGSRIVIT